MIELKEAIVLAKAEPINSSIGIQKEHSLHKVIKYMIDPTGLNHEIKVENKIADIFLDGHIYEIQTKAFNKLRDKLDIFLEKYQVTICYPLVDVKIINRINDEGEIDSIRKSPKRGKIAESLIEFYKIKKYLDNPNLSIMIMVFDIEEYQQMVEKSYRNHHGRLRINQIPINLKEIVHLNKLEDYQKIIGDLPDNFDAKTLAKALKVSVSKISYIIQVLKYMGVIEVIKKDGRKYIYHLVK